MSKVAVKDSKAHIIETFQQILRERQKVASKVATKEEEAEKEQNIRVLEAASQYTADSIVRELADLQLDFGSVITKVSTKLTVETSKLDELKRAIEVETQHLQELRDTRVVADSLYILTQEHQENLQVLEDTAKSDRETLEREIAFSRKTWQQQQEEYEVLLLESNELLSRERQRQEEDYRYDTERSRQIANHENEATKLQIERELQAVGTIKEKHGRR